MASSHQRRAAKKQRRAKRQRSTGTGTGPGRAHGADDYDVLTDQLLDDEPCPPGCDCRHPGDPLAELRREDPEQLALTLADAVLARLPEIEHAMALITGDGDLHRRVAAAADRLLARQWREMQQHGWQPGLIRHVARKLGDSADRLLAGSTAQLPLAMRLRLLGLLMTMPRLPRSNPAELRTVDPEEDRLLNRVRALLAKAEASDYPEEAEALSAKAQQLISRHSLHRALADNATTDRPGVVHLIVDDPYADAKSLLLAAVAEANRCQSVSLGRLGISSVFGHRSDLRGTEMLYTSLLTQATHTLTTQGSIRPGARQPSFRRSFYVAYAGRIHHRLSAAGEQEIADVHPWQFF